MDLLKYDSPLLRMQSMQMALPHVPVLSKLFGVQAMNDMTWMLGFVFVR